MSLVMKKEFRILPAPLIDLALRVADRLARGLVRIGVDPNVLTVLGLLAGIAVGLSYGIGSPALAAVFIFICGVFDVLDGKVASNASRSSLFGAIFDSSLDRYSEFFMYAGLAYHFRHGWGLWLALLAILGSNMVSYTRARAEGLGVVCRVGVMQRAERFVLLFLGTVVGIVFGVFDPALLTALAAIGVVSNFTAAQRILYVKKYEKRQLSKEI
ncbi:MAG: CDP-alcohol phosphatidyltransferase family protein [Candidatus Aminicenantales bacterium]